ncbi:MAG: outer membrane protein multidrug efflux system [Herminiimonas sp.]|nr:outer membrane protein multidrug efflux system [Herminiimonas sp.]
MNVRSICLAGVMTLTACSVGPSYRRPASDVPDSFRAQQETASVQSLADLPWWDVYQDKVLQQLLQTALAQNRDVKIAVARVAEARAQVGVNRIAQLPQVDLAFSAQRGRVFQPGSYVTGGLFNGAADVSFEVDLWQRLASLSDAARAGLLATEYARSSVQISLISDVAAAYFNLLALDQQFGIIERTIVSRERFFQLTQSRFRQGAAAGLDVSRAEASLAATRAGLFDLQRQIEQAENQLQILLGQNPAPVTRPHLDLQALPVPREIPAGLPSALLERRPDVRQAEFNLVAATANVRAAKAALFPTISLTGNYGSESVELSKLFSGPTRIWSFGLNLLQPLINAQRNGYQVDAAQARQEQWILQYQSTVAQAFREVSDALAARRSYAGFLRAQEQQVGALRTASFRVLRRYEVGYSSYFEVIDADSSLLAAELQLVQAYRNNLISLVQLYKALGGGWEQAAFSPVASPPARQP